MPALLLHAREDAAIPFTAGRELAALMPDARFVPLLSKNHILLESDPAWPRFLHEVRQFLGVEPETAPRLPAPTLDPAAWDQLSAFFREALDLPPEGQADVLDRAARAHPPLRSELESLLAAHARTGLTDLSSAFGKVVGASLASFSAAPLQPGQLVSHYEILEKLGSGGMGVVYKARDTRLGRLVALKFLPLHLSLHEEIKQRFVHEARAASTLDHTNICTIFDIGESAGGQLFIAMACYEGQTLREKVAGGPLPLDEALGYALQMADGLERAHEAGIVHRDVKPANVMVTGRGRVKLLDFGIAKMAAVSLTKTGSTLGTAAYMSPEQARGGPVDHRTDVWSLGVVLYEMLTGTRPFRGEYEQAILYSVVHEEPEPVRAVRPEVPEALARVIERMLRKDPGARYQTMPQLRHALAPLRPAAGAPAPGRAQRGAAPAEGEGPAEEDSDTWLHDGEAPVHMVARAEELAFLHDRLAEARRGIRQIVFVTAEAGVGKTTLVDAFIRKTRRRAALRVGHGQCLEHRGVREAYMPVLEALGRLCRKADGPALVELLARQAPTWLVQMPGLVGPEELAALQQRVLGSTKERMLREMVEAVEALTARRPLILILEDLHWSDYSTVDLLSALARRQEPARLLVVGTYRPGDVRRSNHPLHAVAAELTGRGYAHTLALPYLSEAAVGDYLGARFPGTDLPARLAPLVHQRTDGNALFMGNVVEAWIAQGKLVLDGNAWSLHAALDELAVGVPENLRQLIEQKIQYLGEADQAILEAASVVGVEFDAASVSATVEASEDDVEARCDALVRQGQFLHGRGLAEWADGTVTTRYEFVHSLYQEVFYDRVPPGRRVRLHRQIGVRREIGFGADAPAHAAELALHFARGRDAERAVRYLQQAAEQAIRRSAHQEATELIQQALRVLEERPDFPGSARQELTLLLMLAPTLILCDGWASQEAENAFARARDLCHDLGDAARLVQVIQGLATLYEVRGDYQDAEALMVRHLHPEHHHAVHVESHELLACSTFHQGAFERSLAYAEGGMMLFDPKRHNAFSATFGDNPGISCSSWAAMDLWFLGYPDRAHEELQRSLRLARQPDHHYSLAHAQEQAAIFYQCRQEVEAAREWAEATVEVATRQGVAFRRAAGMIVRGWAIALREQAAHGVEQILEGLRLCDAIGARMDRPYHLGLLAEAYGALGCADDGLAALAEALAMVRRSRTFFYEAELHRLHGSLHLRAGAGPAEAAPHFWEALEVARRQTARVLELRAAAYLHRLGDGAGRDARPVLAAAFDWFTEGFETPDLVEARRLLEASGARNMA